MSIHFWKTTRLGRRISGDISTPKNEEVDVLQYLHEMKRGATTDNVADGTGLQIGRASRILRKLKTRRLERELTDD